MGPARERAFQHDTLEAAAAAFTCRFGQAEMEADRRGRLRALLRSSVELSAALDAFTQRATPHMRGDHSMQHLHDEVDALCRALTDWSGSVVSTADLYQACNGTPVPRAMREPEARGPLLPLPADAPDRQVAL